MQETSKKDRFFYNIAIALGSLIGLMYINGFTYTVILVWGFLNLIYVLFFSNKWYNFMDGLKCEVY